MSKKSAKKSSAPEIRRFVVLLISIIGLIVFTIVRVGLDNEIGFGADGTSHPETTESDTVGSPSADISGDVSIIDPNIGKSEHLSLSSVYTSSILNPDCKGEFSEDVVSVEVTNTSDRMLLSAELRAKMSDGTSVIFKLRDLPAGGVAEVFDTSNATLGKGVSCISIECVSETYLDTVPIMTGIELIDGHTVKNNSEKDLTDVKIVYRCSMGDRFFGGIAYEITIESLDAGESFEVTDSGLFGEVAVVRVYQ